MRRGLPILPLLVGLVLVPAGITAFGFSVYGEQLTDALPFSSAPGHVVSHPTRPPLPVRPTVAPAESPVAPPLPASPELTRQNVASLFSSNGVKGITFAPGGTDFVGRGEAVQQGVGNLLGVTTGAVVTLVAHAWNGETASHRCDVLAMQRAQLVRAFLVARGVPEEAISTRVVVDPVWGPPSDGGPQVDVLVG
ncbi:hypothetical protein ABZ816_37700 [Actinosynnema sp. NPDC047251]|uniref:OmpA-like domain-containing protein n=1 Tax=Saccharothrix espanaensis (strain ATCC 51144 / DSM 44229 / JCM 9112 / NBRC 15066 / NRRL 15764) TaxID=1179773 RepID=K0KCG8_SACES|nr:hypothetical protein [Saccharothrix espanaensis]CCH34489.1 hypothetical protein BN6_72560 [Saccharothrix espanaensis DSM 44229]